jgi:hypothetical protein
VNQRPPYNPQSSNQQPYNPQPFNSRPYNPQPFNSRPYNPQPFNPVSSTFPHSSSSSASTAGELPEEALEPSDRLHALKKIASWLEQSAQGLSAGYSHTLNNDDAGGIFRQDGGEGDYQDHPLPLEQREELAEDINRDNAIAALVEEAADDILAAVKLAKEEEERREGLASAAETETEPGFAHAYNENEVWQDTAAAPIRNSAGEGRLQNVKRSLSPSSSRASRLCHMFGFSFGGSAACFRQIKALDRSARGLNVDADLLRERRERNAKAATPVPLYLLSAIGR